MFVKQCLIAQKTTTTTILSNYVHKAIPYCTENYLHTDKKILNYSEKLYIATIYILRVSTYSQNHVNIVNIIINSVSK